MIALHDSPALGMLSPQNKCSLSLIFTSLLVLMVLMGEANYLVGEQAIILDIVNLFSCCTTHPVCRIVQFGEAVSSSY